MTTESEQKKAQESGEEKDVSSNRGAFEQVILGDSSVIFVLRDHNVATVDQVDDPLNLDLNPPEAKESSISGENLQKKQVFISYNLADHQRNLAEAMKLLYEANARETSVARVAALQSLNAGRVSPSSEVDTAESFVQTPDDQQEEDQPSSILNSPKPLGQILELQPETEPNQYGANPAKEWDFHVGMFLSAITCATILAASSMPSNDLGSKFAAYFFSGMTGVASVEALRRSYDR